MTRYDQHLNLWTNAIRAADTDELAETLLGVFAAQTTEWPLALTDIESLDDWTHAGLMVHALKPPAPHGVTKEGEPDAGNFTASYLITLRTLQLVGKLALASEQALHLEDRQTAVQMMRLMRREFTRFKGELSIREALNEIGGQEGPEA